MAFERNDIVNKTRLMGELGEELMGFEHNDIVTVDVMNEAIAEGGGGGGGTATLTATCTNQDVADISIYYTAYVGDGDYLLNGNSAVLIQDEIDLFVGDGNYATFVGSYNDGEVNLVLESVTGDGEIKESGGSKWLEISGDCAVTLSYTP